MGATWDKQLSPEAIKNTIDLAKESMGGETPEVFDTLDLEGYTASELATDLTKVILEQRLFTPRYKYVLVKMYGMRTLMNGATWYDYSDYTDGDSRDARADNTINDFNAEYEPMLREAFNIAEKIHKKNKLPALILSDAWATASGIVGFIMVQREANVRAISKAIEIKAWAEMVNGATFKEVTPEGDETEALAIAKQMYEDLENYETTSTEHEGVGVNGVITVKTVNGDQTIQPEEYFESSEFDVIAKPEYKTNITFDQDATYFNWDATQKTLRSYRTLNFDKYSAMSAEIKTALANAKVIMNHWERMDMLEFFNYQSTVKGASAFEVIHNFSEYDVYLRKDRPTIIYYIAPPVIPEGFETYEEYAKDQAKKALVKIRKGTVKVKILQDTNGDEAQAEQVENKVDQLGKMSKQELITLATQKGMVIPASAKKPEIILALTQE